jgi:hypothetical protein
LGLLHPDAVGTSIEAMAEFSVKSIRAVQPDGPYFVGGWCSAGLIAYETAQQLLIQGQEVALLTLLDAVNPCRLDGLSVPQVLFVLADETFRKIWFLRSMSRLNFRELPAYVCERLKSVWHTLTRRTWPARDGINPNAVGQSCPSRRPTAFRGNPHGRVLALGDAAILDRAVIKSTKEVVRMKGHNPLLKLDVRDR